MRRQRHEDGLGSATRLQPEERAAVVDQVELDIAPAAVELEASLPLPKRHGPALFQDGKIGRQEGVADRAREAEGKIEVALSEVVEEDAADAARLIAVLEVKVAVAPRLEARVVIRAEGLECLLAAAMEVARVLLEAVIRGEIHAAAEPPGVLRGEKAHVEVNGWAVGVARMQDQRYPHRLPGLPGELRARGRCRGRELRSLDAREIDSAALEEPSILDHAREPAAAFGTLPFVGLEGVAVGGFKGVDDLFLQCDEVVGDVVDEHVNCA